MLRRRGSWLPLALAAVLPVLFVAAVVFAPRPQRGSEAISVREPKMNPRPVAAPPAEVRLTLRDAAGAPAPGRKVLFVPIGEGSAAAAALVADTDSSGTATVRIGRQGDLLIRVDGTLPLLETRLSFQHDSRARYDVELQLPAAAGAP